MKNDQREIEKRKDTVPAAEFDRFAADGGDVRASPGEELGREGNIDQESIEQSR